MKPKPNDSRTYRTREFAKLAGVTVRALHHYDRLGLLKPKRTLSGYRAYSIRDLEGLEQIVALKFIGLPLKAIPILRQGNAATFANSLQAQRRILEQKRHLLDQAISAISEVEGLLRSGKEVDDKLFKRIIEVIEMQNNSAEWKKNYDALVQTKIERLKSLSPDVIAELRTQWAALIEEIQQALDEDPTGPRAQALATRWITLLERLMGGPVQPSMLGSATAYKDLEKWSPSAAQFADKRVWDFISKALASRPNT
jgi:MerR family transcriptional regulator, thiopeptide resistance regulator